MLTINFSDKAINQGNCYNCSRCRMDSYNYTIICAVTMNNISSMDNGVYCPYYLNGEPIKI